MYKVEFNKSKLSNKTIVKESKCIVAISIGAEAYEHHKLVALLRIVNKTFSECTFIIGDTLNRHNYLLFPNHTPEECYDYCKDSGDQWLQRNMQNIISEISIPFKIVRWDAFLEHKDLIKHYDQIEHNYNNQVLYKTTFNAAALEFLKRNNRNNIVSQDSELFQQSLKYLKEEAAVMCLWPELGCEYKIYHSKDNAVMDLIYVDLLQQKHPNLLKILSLRFFKNSDNDEDYIQQINATQAINTMIETIPGHIYWKNKNGIYLGCNLQQAKYYGFDSPSEVINKADSDVLDYKVAHHIRKNDLEVMKNGSCVIIEEENKGEIFLSSKAAIKDNTGNTIGIVGFSLNITKEKMLAKKLKKQTEILSETLKTKDRVLNNLSHEIRTPIHVISSLTEGLLGQYHQMTDDERIEFIKLLNTTSGKLAKLVNNLLLVAKVRKDKSLTNIEDVDLVEIIKSIVKELSVISKSELNIDAPQTLHLNCTKYQIEQVIRNLLENAIRYGNNKPIVIYLKKRKDKVVIEVIDQGIGVPEEEKLSIFEVFEESRRTKSSSGGTGLGLAICKDIVGAHNGKIFVEPGENNCGSKFVVVLPIINKHEKI